MLTVERLSKNFDVHILGDKRIAGCRQISFEVNEGEFVALSGPSGAGKSTILKCLYRTYLPTEGKVRYQNQEGKEVDLARADERTVIDLRHREIGYVSQFLEVVPRVPALEVVMEPMLSRNGTNPEEAREQAEELLRSLMIPESLWDAYPATFSGGEQQRINIARALGWQPRLLLLDEPTASLDRDSVAIVLNLLKELRQRGTTMVGIFHDKNVMRATADRVISVGTARKESHV